MEQWKDINGYEGYYLISNTGKVKSLDRDIVRNNGLIQHRRGADKVLTENQDGYLTVNLSKDGLDKRIAVHILVAEAFVDGKFEGAEVNHIDCNRKNNYYKNLEWVTHLDNIKHTINNNKHVSQVFDFSGQNNPNYGNRKLSEKYARDKDLAKKKQSRPGSQNGRAVPVTMLLSNDDSVTFGTISECAEYLINNNFSSSKSKNCVAVNISKAIKQNKTYCGLNFKK